MSKGDGKNPKFRLLCKRCNSYMHTDIRVMTDQSRTGSKLVIVFLCTKCGTIANRLDEE